MRKEESRAVTLSGNESPADPAGEIAAWKREEQRTAAGLSRRLAAFNPSGARLLGDWVPVFDYTARCAEYWRLARANPAGGFAAIPEPHGRALAEAAHAQTEAFAVHLERLADGARVSGRAEDADALAQAAAAARERLTRLARLARQDWREPGTGGLAEREHQEPGRAGRGEAEREHQGPGRADRNQPDRVQADGGQPDRSRPEHGEPDRDERDRVRPVRAVPIGGHTLPPLPYACDALEPYIDEATMRIHHDRHHRAYVDGLNRAERELQAARASGQFDLVKHWERELAFNGAGHYLHTIFWNVMSPQGGGRPTGPLAEAIHASFGSFEAFRRQFSAAAEQVEGGGWAILVWSPRSGRLEILQAEKHQNLSQWDVVPLLPLDVWEHAYYLKHQNRRADYIRDWWNVVNWPHVAERFAKASQLRWEPF
jgi:Fe-Mn family superoxide dismutase